MLIYMQVLAWPLSLDFVGLLHVNGYIRRKVEVLSTPMSFYILLLVWQSHRITQTPVLGQYSYDYTYNCYSNWLSPEKI